MHKLCRKLVLVVGCSLVWPAVGAPAQEAPVASNVVHVIGLEGVKKKTKGKLFLGSGKVRFEAGKAKAELTTASIQDVFTSADNKALIGGALGRLTMAMPYESDRFLALFRRGIDVVTLKYRDAQGALHGVVFSCPKGEAPGIKRQMVAQGAHASIPPEPEREKPAAKKEKKP